MKSKPFEVKMTNIGEVRMGSPYNDCEVELIGASDIKLNKYGWQDKYAWSEDNKKLILIQFDFEKNTPGFRLFIIDTVYRETKLTERYEGLINSISVSEDKAVINKFLYDKNLSAPGKLCCNTEEVLELF